MGFITFSIKSTCVEPIETCECRNEAKSERAAKAAEPIAKPLPTAAVVFPTESNLSVIPLTSGSRCRITSYNVCYTKLLRTLKTKHIYKIK